jgi:Transposase DDE domain
MAIFAQLASTLQDLLGPVAQSLAAPKNLIRRHRKFSASSLLSTFVLGYWQKPLASLDDLAQTAAQLGVDVSPQAIDKRFQAPLRDALRDLLEHALQTIIDTNPRAWPLLRSFTTVQLADSTTISLAAALADEYPRGGGSHGVTAAMKLHVQWDLTSGRFVAAVDAARTADNRSTILDTPLPAGSLVLRDLGYFDLDRFAKFNADNISWISRTKANLVFTIDGQRHKLVDWLARQRGDLIDQTIKLGDQLVACRLVACRVPASVARKRQQAKIRKSRKKYGRVPSVRQLTACAWTIYVTNLVAESFDAAAIHTMYRVRWQIELLFKLWKSHAHLGRHRSEDPVRQLIELFSRLLGVVLQHWVLITTGWPQGRLSVVKAARVLREFVPVLLSVWRDRKALASALERLSKRITRCRLTTRRRCPGTHQTLEIQERSLS